MQQMQMVMHPLWLAALMVMMPLQAFVAGMHMAVPEQQGFIEGMEMEIQMQPGFSARTEIEHMGHAAGNAGVPLRDGHGAVGARGRTPGSPTEEKSTWTWINCLVRSLSYILNKVVRVTRAFAPLYLLCIVLF